MKLFKYLPIAFAMAAMVGCSDDNFVDAPESNILEDGGSVTVNINLPTSMGTRTTGLNDLDDGDENEFAINSALVVLYDAGQNYITSITWTPEFSSDDAAFITSSQIIPLDKGTLTPKYALALLNAAGTDIAVAATGSATFTVFQNTIAEEGLIGNTKDGFFMSNSTFDNDGAPASVYKTSTPGIQSLQEINPNSISNSDNTANVATNIYVERAAVKVDLEFFNGASSPLTNGDTFANDTDGMPTYTFKATSDVLTLGGWNLTVTNKEFYNVKLIDQDTWTAWKDVDTYQMGAYISAPQWFRSFWAIDPSYVDGPTAATATDVPATGYTNFNYKSYNDATIKSKNGGKLIPLYCTENTFKAINQNQDQTTSVLIAGTYAVSAKSNTDNTDVYTIMGKAVSTSNAAKEIATTLAGVGYVKYNGTETSALTAEDFMVGPTDDSNSTNYTNLVNFNTNGGTNKLRKVGSDDNVIEEVNNYASMTTILATVLNGAEAFVYYPAGKCYYIIPIRHFDDTEVKLYSNPNSSGAKEYFWTEDPGVNKVNQEGRYGVVRNHWYSVNVQSISKIGEPTPLDPGTPITPPTTPDDEENRYLNAKINILPWAKRNQNADI